MTAVEEIDTSDNTRDPLEIEIEQDVELQRVLDRVGNFATATRGSGAVIQIDNGKAVSAVATCAAICGVSAVLAIVSAIVAWNTTTESRLQQQHTMTLEAKQKVLIDEVEALKHEQRR